MATKRKLTITGDFACLDCSKLVRLDGAADLSCPTCGGRLQAYSAEADETLDIGDEDLERDAEEDVEDDSAADDDAQDEEQDDDEGEVPDEDEQEDDDTDA